MKEKKQLRPDAAVMDAAEPLSAAPANPGRRKIAKAGLSAPVLMTVASRSAWGNQCSISGIQSGNVSRAADEMACEGCSVSYWRGIDLNNWPTNRNTNFERVFNVGAYRNGISLLDVLNSNDELGAQAVAAYLNAVSGINFGYTGLELASLVSDRWSSPQGDLLGDLQLINNQFCPL